ncbi:hypothetical protein F2Q70_00032546 [Brassica cretica]|uniref:Pentacotripeptide-repeat region of PRORP domain-containing protein n=1 Tax=Brassica cretica TaxID=69181 RepID=A0A8S9FHU9_BRACR|nr:hypothetical protein F2Q70_00032546 [Brassica cretica]
MYARCDSLEQARKVFDTMPHRNVVSYNALCSAYSRSQSHASYAFDLITRMASESLEPNSSTFTSLVQVCTLLEDVVMGSLLHSQIIKLGFLDNVVVQTSVLGMYSSCGELESARKVFECVEGGDAVVWNTMISGRLRNGEIEEGLALFRTMLMSGVVPTQFTYSMVLNACSKLGSYSLGKLTHARIIVSDGLADSVVENALLDMYCSCGDVKEALFVFERIHNPNLVAWNSIISGCSENGFGEEAILMYGRLQRRSTPRPDEYTLSAVICATGETEWFIHGKLLHGQVMKLGYERSVFVGTTLLSMYFKNGEAESAQKVFDLVSNPDLKCWNSMLGAYSQHGMLEKALSFFEQILQNGLTPDAVTYLSLLVACSNSGSTQQGKFLWNQMKERGIKAGFKHYSCMVNLVSKAGLVDEALELIQESHPVNNNQTELWRTLLSACVNTRNLQMGLYAGEQILRLDPEDTATYILLSNLYAVKGRWEDVAEMRRKIRGLASAKDPGLSWIEVNNNSTQVFSSGDQSNTEVIQVQDELHRLKSNMLCRSSSPSIDQDQFLIEPDCSH